MTLKALRLRRSNYVTLPHILLVLCTTCNFLALECYAAIPYITWGTGGNTRSTSIQVDIEGNSYVGGCTSSRYKSSEYLGGTSDGFVAKYTPRGQLLWYKPIGTTHAECVTDIELHEKNGVLIIMGYTSGTLEGDAVAEKDMDIFISELDLRNGTVHWMKQYGTSSNDYGTSVKVDLNSSTIHVVGYTQGEFLGETSAGSTCKPSAPYEEETSCDNGIVLSVDSQGETLWSKQLKGEGRNRLYALDVDNSGDIVVLGQSRGKLDDTDTRHDKNKLRSLGIYPGDLIMMKISREDGSTVWGKQFGTDQSDLCYMFYHVQRGSCGLRIQMEKDGKEYAYGTGMTSGFMGKKSWKHQLENFDVFPTGTEFSTKCEFGTSFCVNTVVMKVLTSDGSADWVTQIVSSVMNNGNDIAFTSNGNTVVMGTTDTGGLTMEGSRRGMFKDMFLAEFDHETGERLALNQLGSHGADFGSSIALQAPDSNNIERVLITASSNLSPLSPQVSMKGTVFQVETLSWQTVPFCKDTVLAPHNISVAVEGLTELLSITIMRSPTLCGVASIDYTTDEDLKRENLTVLNTTVARPYVDYVPSRGTVVFIEGENQTEIQLNVLNNEEHTSKRRMVRIVLFNPSQGTTVNLVSNEIWVEIIEDDSPTFGTDFEKGSMWKRLSIMVGTAVLFLLVSVLVFGRLCGLGRRRGKRFEHAFVHLREEDFDCGGSGAGSGTKRDFQLLNSAVEFTDGDVFGSYDEESDLDDDERFGFFGESSTNRLLDKTEKSKRKAATRGERRSRRSPRRGKFQNRVSTEAVLEASNGSISQTREVEFVEEEEEEEEKKETVVEDGIGLQNDVLEFCDDGSDCETKSEVETNDEREQCVDDSVKPLFVRRKFMQDD